MVQVKIRVTLTDQLGNTKVTSEPGGWDTSVLGLVRHPQLLSLVEFYKSSFQLYGSNGSEDGGRDWVLNVERRDGPDALIAVLVEIDSNDDDNYRTAFNGNLGVGLFIETLDLDHLLQVVFANSDFWSKIMARWQTNVDIRSFTDLDGNPVQQAPKFSLPLPSQKIIKKYSAYLQFNTVFQTIDIPNVAFLIGFDNESLKEIQDQSSLKLTLMNGSDRSMTGAQDPSYYDLVVPYFNPIDDGSFIIDKLQFTMSQSGYNSDANVAGHADYVCATNDKNVEMSNVDFYLQQNTNKPIKLTKAHRAVAGSFVRNDGITETLLANLVSPFVTDFSLPPGTELTIKKFDAIKLFGIYNDIFDLPYPQIRNGLTWMWGTDGWSHDSGYDQIRAGLGSYIKYRGTGTIHDDSNQGSLAYGGLFAPAGSFPSTITDDGGIGLAIKSLQWWVAGVSGNVAGGTHLVNKGQVMQAKIDNPTDSLADWYIWDKTPYEGLEAYGADNGFQITFNTTATDSTTEAFLTHDVMAGIIDRIAGKPKLFYSEYLGNQWTSRIYAATGCGSLKANMLGLHVRGYPIDGAIDPTQNKAYAPSAQDWFDGINPIDCLGMGYEKKTILGSIDTYSFVVGGAGYSDGIVLASGGTGSDAHFKITTLAGVVQTATVWDRGVGYTIGDVLTLNGGAFNAHVTVTAVDHSSDVVRCERAEHFFDDSSMSILFSNVQTMKRSYDPDWQFNSIDYGYDKWQSQAANGVGTPSGIDDPQSQGTRNTIFKIIGKKLKIMSKWLGAGLAIETMRRLGVLLSANYTYDDETVVIWLHSNGDGTFRPELDENYSAITNLSNSGSRYNISGSSTRNFLRWVKYLSGCLQSYLTSSFKFVPGQGNYTMSSTKTTSCVGDETGSAITENGDIPIGIDFLFLPMPFEIDHYMDFDDYETLVANKNLAIGISQTDSGHKKFFIDDTSGLEYNIATGLVHLKAWPKEDFVITVPDTFSSVGSSSGKYFEQPYFEEPFE